MSLTMAHADPTSRQRESLPSISDLDLEKGRFGPSDQSKFSAMTGLNISSAPLGSPTTVYSGPPPPYSYSASNAGAVTQPSGYISPPESSRRSTRDEKDSPTGIKSLPSLSEALGDKIMPYSSANSTNTPPMVTQPGSAPLSIISQSFPEAPRGPSNPFSHPPVSASTARDTSSMAQHAQSQPHPPREEYSIRPPFPSVNTTDVMSHPPHMYSGHPSPRISAGPHSSSSQTGFSKFPGDHPPATSPNVYGVPRSAFTFQNQSNPPSASFPQPVDSFRIDRPAQLDPHGHHFRPAEPNRPYGESVKRHLEDFDVELALSEILEASTRTQDFSRDWCHRSHHANRTGYFPEALPNLPDIEDMLRCSGRIMDALAKIRDVAIAQQTALSEQRARAARGDHMMTDYAGLHDDYKNYTGGDAKKRRGKAAPPGRCHSCNRAETPEWRRGPDGARTLCNACGLHYAKLTRKIGVNKAAQLTGSNLRPKNLEQGMTTPL